MSSFCFGGVQCRVVDRAPFQSKTQRCSVYVDIKQRKAENPEIVLSLIVYVLFAEYW